MISYLCLLAKAERGTISDQKPMKENQILLNRDPPISLFCIVVVTVSIEFINIIRYEHYPVLYLFSNGISDITSGLIDGTIWTPGPDKKQLSESVERALVTIWNGSVFWCFRVKPSLPSFTRLVVCNL